MFRIYCFVCIVILAILKSTNCTISIASRDNLNLREKRINMSCVSNDVSPIFDNFVCKCPKIDWNRDKFVCDCSSKTSSARKYACNCETNKKVYCECKSLFGRSYKNLHCSKDYDIKENSIKIGVLLPFTLGKKKISAYYSANYYASAIYLAINDINNDQRILPNHKLSLVWTDSKCDPNVAIRAQWRMFQNENTDVLIASGCSGSSETLARNAAALNKPMIEYMSISPKLSNKKEFPTLARVSPIGSEYTLALKNLLEHYKWKKIGIIVEKSTRFQLAYNDIKSRLNINIVATANVTPQSFYSYEGDYEALKRNIKEMSRKTKIIVILSEVRTTKECLIAASELGLTNGKRVFITFSGNVEAFESRQRNPFKWPTADYSSVIKPNNYKGFIDRSKHLCNAWQSSLMIATTSAQNKKATMKNHENVFDDRIRQGVKKFFNSTVYEGKIPGTDYNKNSSKPPSLAMELYDAIRMYAIAVDNAIKNGENYQNGKTVMKYFEDRLFQSVKGSDVFFNDNLDVQPLLKVYHYGGKTTRTLEICECIFSDGLSNAKFCKYPFPKMVAIGSFLPFAKRQNETQVNMKYLPIPNTPMYWPGGVRIEDIRD